MQNSVFFNFAYSFKHRTVELLFNILGCPIGNLKCKFGEGWMW